MSKKKADIKVIVTDIDGTLLNSQHKLTERTEKALKAAMAQGIKVVLATGKTRRSVDDIIKRLDLKTPGIYVQGLVISHPDGSEEHLGTLDAGLMRRVLTFIEDRGFQAMAYSGKRILVRNNTAEAIILTEEYDEPKPEVVGPLVNIVEDVPINKLIFCGREAKHITALRWQLTHLIDGDARITQALPDAIELLPFGASKGTALKLLLKEMGLEPENMLAIGDGENDIEMIQLAGMGVAMGNANPKLKAVADATVASNDEDGVAEAIEKFVLKATEKPAEPAKPVEPVKVEAKPVEAAKSDEKPVDEKPAEPAKTEAVVAETKSE